MSIHQTKSLTTLIRLGLTLILLAGILAVPQGRAGATTTHTLVVDTYADLHDNSVGDGVCNALGNVCTLRAAIEEAAYSSSASNPYIIHFSITGSPDLVLGTLYMDGDYVTVDGYPNNNILSGAGLSAGASLIEISGNHNLLENLSISGSKGDGVQIGDFLFTGEGNYNDLNNVYIYGSAWSGVYIHGTATGGNSTRILNSHIGANSASVLCATPVNNGYDGIYINGGADQTQIINDTVVCSLHNGIYIAGPGSSDTIINSSHIGTTGNNYVIGNGWNGVEDQQNTNTQISNNIISGNSQYGIYLDGSLSAKIYGNKVGTNETGDHAMANLWDGIILDVNANGTEIGSATDSSKRNIISGNGQNGVLITGGSYSNVLDGNYIGLSANGSAAIPNGNAGVAIINAGWNALSSPGDSPLPQFISGNSREGVYLCNAYANDINKRTFIGVAANMSTPMGNQLEGVKLDVATSSSEIYSQKIVYNGGAGIAVLGTTSTANYLMPWFVGRNGGLPIDLGDDGHTGNGDHVPPGPNNWQGYPVPVLMTADGFYGQTCANCIVYIYRAVNDPTLPLGGGGAPVTLTADSGGSFSYSIPVDVVAVTMEACNPSDYSCSEMGPAVINPALQFIYLPLVIK